MRQKLLSNIRKLVVFLMIAIALSGITAFPVYTELNFVLQRGWLDTTHFPGSWLNEVFQGIADTQSKYPFLFYGFDWLAFAHIVIAALFYGVYKDPVRNKFIVDWGIFCCIAIIPLAFICGPIRGIPLLHMLIDCSFGVIGIIPLLICRKLILQLEKIEGENKK